MSFRDQPNASYFSARYAERKRAQQRARDEARGPVPCNKCPKARLPEKIFCGEHLAEREVLAAKYRAGEISLDELDAFGERTYWPPEVLAPKRARRRGA